MLLAMQYHIAWCQSLVLLHQRAQKQRGPTPIAYIIKEDEMGTKCTMYGMEKGIKMNPKK